MALLTGKVAIVTGAGRGLGREEALALAAAGARVIVNDIGTSVAGEGNDQSPAAQVVKEIKAAGGEAIANYEDIASWDGARRTIDQAYDTYGKLDILVNNAGVLRDRMNFNMSEEEFDLVLRVHCKGHFAMTRHACVRWREMAKQSGSIFGRVINTSSEAGLDGLRRQQQLRDGQGGDRSVDDQHGARDGQVRRDRELHRAARAHAHDRHHAEPRHVRQAGERASTSSTRRGRRSSSSSSPASRRLTSTARASSSGAVRSRWSRAGIR